MGNNKKKVLITGIAGFVGSHLAELLLKKGFLVYGLERWMVKNENIEHIKERVEVEEADILDAHSVYSFISRVKPDFIFHLAAQSFVPTSWANPSNTMEVNVNGSINLFEAVRRAEIDPVIQIACCYDEKTKALTPKGLKHFTEIKEGDLVLSINPKNREVSWKPVSKIIVDNYRGEMIHIKGKRIDLLVTPNHRCYFEDKGRTLKSVDANDLSGDYRLPRGQSVGKAPKKIKGFLAKDLLYLLGLYIGDGYGDAIPRMFVTKTGLSRKEYLNCCRDSQGRFKELAEKPSVGFSATARVFIAIPRNGKARKSTEQCLKNLQVKYSGYDDCLYFSSKALLKILKTAGQGAKTKHIPRWAFDYSPELLKEVYRGIVDSDGTWRKKRESITTVSFGLVETLIELCARIRLTCTYSFLGVRKSKFQNRIITTNSKGVYTLSISHRPKQVRSSLNVYRGNYKGKIWCVEVADNHTLMVARNGKTDFSGNSSEEYGLVKEGELPIKEENPLRPLSTYAVSKVAMDFLGYQYFKSYGLKIVRTRGFNHTGPRRGEVFVCSSFAKQIAEIEKGKRKAVIEVGDLSSRRDFTDVRDMVKAYLLAVEKGEPGDVYNIASEKTWEIGKVLEILLSFSKTKVKIKKDPKRMRPSDVPVLLGDASKFKKKTGWRTTIPFEQTLEDLLNYWRGRV